MCAGSWSSGALRSFDRPVCNQLCSEIGSGSRSASRYRLSNTIRNRSSNSPSMHTLLALVPESKARRKSALVSHRGTKVSFRSDFAHAGDDPARIVAAGSARIAALVSRAGRGPAPLTASDHCNQARRRPTRPSQDVRIGTRVGVQPRTALGCQVVALNFDHERGHGGQSRR